MHCRDTKTFPVVPRHGLVSCISVPDSMERHKTRLKAPKCLISLITVFLGRPVILVSQKVGQVQESLQRESVELDTQILRVSSFVRHPVDTKLASRRATEKIFYTKFIRI